jgi:Carboxypeptidase regulatory-like domain
MRQLSLLPFLLIWFSVSFLRCAAQQPDAYTISGIVINDSNGEPLINCAVHLTTMPRSRMHPASQTDSFLQDSLTDEQGHFTFEHVPRGIYKLMAEKRGFPSRAYEEHDGYSTSIVTGPNLDTEGLVFRLIPSSLIFGFVTDEANEPVRNALVHLYRDKSRDGDVHGWQSMTVTPTDDLGRFEFPDLSPGKYYISVSAHPWYAQNSIHQEGGQNTSPNDAPENSDLDVTYATTFYPGAIDPTAAEPVILKSGERVQTDISLSPIQALHLRVLTAAGAQSLSLGYGIQQILPDGTSTPASIAIQRVSPGVIEINGLAPGRYNIQMSGNTSGPRGASAEFQKEIDLTTSTTLDERSPSSADEVEVKGKVLLPPGTPRQSGAIVKFQTVRSFDRRSGQLLSAQIGQDGTFQISLPPGEFRIFTENLGAASIGQISAEGARASGRIVTLNTGQQSASIVIQMTNGFASLHGFAQRGDKPASAVAVLLIPDNSKEALELLRRDQSNSDGSFNLERVIPGHYQLIAVERGWEVDWTSPEAIQQYFAHGIPMEFKAGDDLQKNVPVQPR